MKAIQLTGIGQPLQLRELPIPDPGPDDVLIKKMVGLTQKSFPVAPYQNVINKEAEIIGVSDHLASELPQLLEMARDGRLRFPPGTIQLISLDALAINQTLDALTAGADQIRTVIQM